MEWDRVEVQLGQVLRRMREGRRLSQEQFALACGISRAYYGRVERGEFSATVGLCKRIADALGLTMADLFRDIV